MGTKQSTPPRSRACSNTGEMPVMGNGAQGTSSSDQNRARTQSLGSFSANNAGNSSNVTHPRIQHDLGNTAHRNHAEPVIARPYPVHQRRQFAAQSLPVQLFSFPGKYLGQ